MAFQLSEFIEQSSDCFLFSILPGVDTSKVSDTLTNTSLTDLLKQLVQFFVDTAEAFLHSSYYSTKSATMKASSFIFNTATLLLFFACSSNASAQSPKPKYEAGMRLSGIIYQGDLAPSAIGSYKTPTLGFGLFVTRILNRHFLVRGNIDYSRLKGDDAVYSSPEWKQQRNFNFKASALEVAAHFIYSLTDNYGSSRFSPYVFGGAGISFLNISRDHSQFNYTYNGWQDWVLLGLQDDIAQSPPKLAVILPVGAGVRYPLNDKLTLFGEGSYRFMFTDYLDGFSKSADPKHKDHYANISLGIIYRFGRNGINCPKY